MKGLKKLALATAVLAVSTGAFAMEAMQDDALANTTGQDGLSILQSNLAVSIAAVRYTDSDGTTGASAALGIPAAPTFPVADGPCAAGSNPQACADSFSSAGTLHIQGLSITASSILTTIDVGSTSTTSGGVTGLLIGSKINNLSVNLGAISFDNGNELAADPTTGNSLAANASATTNIGGIALTHINLPASTSMLITAGAAALGQTSGLTITSLTPIADLSLVVSYYNTSLTSYTPGVVGSATNPADFTTRAAVPGPTNAFDGLISLPIDMKGILTGSIEVAAGLQSSGYNITPTQGLIIGLGQTFISSVDIGNQAGGAGGINITGTTVGSVGIIGLSIGSSQLNISGH
jgi:hypothetical protein